MVAKARDTVDRQRASEQRVNWLTKELTRVCREARCNKSATALECIRALNLAIVQATEDE